MSIGKLILCSCIIGGTTYCKREKTEILFPVLPAITNINAPKTMEISDGVYITCEVENSELLDLRFKWEATAGILIHADSSTVFYASPPKTNDIILSCSISDSTGKLDKDSVRISFTYPAFVGSHSLRSLTACGSIYNFQNDVITVLEIYDTHTSGKGFAYSWKEVRAGIPVPDSCFLQMLTGTHNGFMGKWRNASEADSLLYFQRPVQLGYITRIIKWSDSQGNLVLEHSQSGQKWIFKKR